MKQIFNYIILAFVTLFIAISCNNDLDNIHVEGQESITASSLTVEGSSVIALTDENADVYPLIFNWTKTLMGSTVIPVAYTLQVDTTDLFETAYNETVGTNLYAKGFTNTQLNDWALKFQKNKQNPEEVDLFVRISASVLATATTPIYPNPTAYSNYVTLNVTPAVAKYPDNIYMIGADFGDWSWDSPDIVELIPVHGKEVYSFWTIKYLTAGNGFKFASAKGWDGSFGVLGEVEGVTTDNDGNARVAESGLYMIYIDMVNEKMVIEKPQVSGMGDAFGGWTMGQYPFTIDAGGKLMSITTLNAGDLRMCTTSSLAQEANIDWWKMEFIILNGKIEYRGQGNDQDRVPVTAGKVVTLNFQNNTGTIQ